MITVLGASGFIGSHLVQKMTRSGIPHQIFHKDEALRDKDLGRVVYCIGLTADFRQRPLDAVEAHVCKVLDLLRSVSFESFLYLSSTRVYNPARARGKEEGDLVVNPANPGDLYNISKLMGEALLHACGKNIQIARLSNVYGMDFTSDNFLADVIRRSVDDKQVVLETTLDSEKDYISVDDAVNALIQISLKGTKAVYNVASGRNVSNRVIMERLSALTGCHVRVRPDARTIKFPQIDVERIHSEFNCQPSDVLGDMEFLVQVYRKQRGENDNDHDRY